MNEARRGLSPRRLRFIRVDEAEESTKRFGRDYKSRPAPVVGQCSFRQSHWLGAKPRPTQMACHEQYNVIITLVKTRLIRKIGSMDGDTLAKSLGVLQELFAG